MTTPQSVVAGRFPGAMWKPINGNHSIGGNHPRLLICHIMEGTLEGTDAWFRNPDSNVSAHFGVAKTGKIWQWVDVQDTAWHASAANDHSIGVEHEGISGDPLTAAQILATAYILAWAHHAYPAIRTWLNTRPDTGAGLSWHGLGGAAWGGHPNCPGLPVVHQLPAILERVAKILV